MRLYIGLIAGLLGCAAGNKKPAPANGDTGEPCQPGPTLMVSETATGRLHVVNADSGNIIGTVCLTEFHPDECVRGTHGLDRPCLLFGVEHTVTEGEDILTLAYTLRNPNLAYAPGAVAEIPARHPIEPHWVMTALSFSDALLDAEGFTCTDPDAEPRCHLFGAHAAVPHPDGTLMIADTSNSRLLWVRPPEAYSGKETGTVEAILSSQHPDWDNAQFINHVQRISQGDAEWVLLTFKGSKPSGLNSINAGRIVMWDVTDRSAPSFLWSYPEDGSLAAVHQAMIQDTPLGTLMTYAHSLGASNVLTDGNGSIGIARFNGAAPPTYLGDGVIVDDTPLGFVRDVEWIPHATTILVTDSGCENADVVCDRVGQVRTLALPNWSDPGLSGAYSSSHENQLFFSMEEIPFSGPPPLTLPYDGDLISVDALGSPLSSGRLGSCPD